MITQSFILDGFYGLQTFEFDEGFRNLTSVVWEQVNPFHLFDNITLSKSVPEPTTALLLACGLVGLGVRRRLH